MTKKKKDKELDNCEENREDFCGYCKDCKYVNKIVGKHIRAFDNTYKVASVLLFCLIVVYSLTVIAFGVLPIIAIESSAVMNISHDTPLTIAIAVWLIPYFFIVAFVFYATLVGVKFLRKVLKSLGVKWSTKYARSIRKKEEKQLDGESCEDYWENNK